MAEPENGPEGSFISHLLELRNRLLYAVAGVGVIGVALLIFGWGPNELYEIVATPLIKKGGSVIATDIAAPFMIPIKLFLVVSFVLSAPWLLYQVWAFVAPGLYRRERKLIAPLLISSTLLFYAGMAFAYFVVFPPVFQFFITTAPPGVTVMTDIKSYLDFVFGMFIAFGVAFEVPIAVIVLCHMGVINPETLAAKRSYVFLGVFVVAAVLTPPDVFSQVALALPMYALFEIGLLVARRTYRRKQDESAAAVDDEDR